MNNDLKSLALKLKELHAKLEHAEQFELDRAILVYKEEIQEIRKNMAGLIKDKAKKIKA